MAQGQLLNLNHTPHDLVKKFKKNTVVEIAKSTSTSMFEWKIYNLNRVIVLHLPRTIHTMCRVYFSSTLQEYWTKLSSQMYQDQERNYASFDKIKWPEDKLGRCSLWSNNVYQCQKEKKWEALTQSSSSLSFFFCFWGGWGGEKFN